MLERKRGKMENGENSVVKNQIYKVDGIKIQII